MREASAILMGRKSEGRKLDDASVAQTCKRPCQVIGFGNAHEPERTCQNALLGLGVIRGRSNVKVAWSGPYGPRHRESPKDQERSYLVLRPHCGWTSRPP